MQFGFSAQLDQYADVLAIAPYVLPVAAVNDVAATLTQLQPFIHNILNSTSEAGQIGDEPSHSLAEHSHADALAMVPYVQPVQTAATSDLATLLTELQPYIHQILDSHDDDDAAFGGHPLLSHPTEPISAAFCTKQAHAVNDAFVMSEARPLTRPARQFDSPDSLALVPSDVAGNVAQTSRPELSDESSAQAVQVSPPLASTNAPTSEAVWLQRQLFAEVSRRVPTELYQVSILDAKPLHSFCQDS